MSKQVILFLEYKFRDFTDIELLMPNATGVIIPLEKVTQERLSQIQRLNLDLGICISAASAKGCPADKVFQKLIMSKITKATNLYPKYLWFDHIRFPGRWEVKRGNSTYHPHEECIYCKSKNRSEVITSFATELKYSVPKTIMTGYFAVPYKADIKNDWEVKIGQDHKALGNIFDNTSPMLYHRMIGKPVSYISEYSSYLRDLKVSAGIFPAVQLKDMPDELEDKLSIPEIKKEIVHALKAPSEGIVLFSWDQTIEKNKIKPVSKILSKIN